MPTKASCVPVWLGGARDAGVSRAASSRPRLRQMPAMTDEIDDVNAAPRELPIDGVLDLHTFAPREIPDLVATWLSECHARGIYELRIIHGKGKGHLRRQVHALLSRRSDVVRFELAPEDRGGWGATWVLLRR